MSNPIVRGLLSIATFSGRDRRGQFWPYAGAVVVLTFMVMAVCLPWAMSDTFAEMQQFAAQHPEAATVHSAPGQYSIEIDPTHPNAPMPDFRAFFAVLALAVGLAVALLAAAVSRRLHDRNKSALWGLLPVVFLSTGLVAFPAMMNDMMSSPRPNMGLFLLLFLNNVVYLLSLAGLVIVLSLPGNAGPNRFGPEPNP